MEKSQSNSSEISPEAFETLLECFKGQFYLSNAYELIRDCINAGIEFTPDQKIRILCCWHEKAVIDKYRDVMGELLY